MLTTIEAYLTLRRATGFAMSNAEYLLKSFAAFAAGCVFQAIVITDSRRT